MKDLVTIQQLSAAGRHQECLQACQNALQVNPEEAYSYKYAGKSLLALGQFEKAQQCLVRAHQLDGSDPEIVKDIGNIFLNLGNQVTALEWYEKALEINNNYAPAINNLGSLKRQLGNHKEAVNLFKRAIQADPKLIQAYVGAAASYLTLGDLDQAESFADQALAINEIIPGVNEILGIVFQNKSKPDQAIECYQKELEVNPQASNSLLNLGLLLLQKGQTVAAVESLAKASTLAPSEQCSLLLAQAYQNLGQFKEAIVEYKKLDIDQSKNKMIPFNLGLCLLNTGNNIDAIEAFKIAIQLDESFTPAWGNIGSALMNEGRHQEALPATQKVLDLDPDNSDAHMNLGGIYKELGNLDQALASTLKSLELNPDNPDAHRNLGGIYKELGQLDQALAATLKSLELNPDNPDAQMNLGGIYKELGQLDQALASTLKSLDLKADNADAHMTLGGIYKDLGRLDQALTSTLKSLELNPDHPASLINLGIIYKSKAACLFSHNDIDGALNTLKAFSDEYLMRQELRIEFDIAAKACIWAQAYDHSPGMNTVDKDLIVSDFRPVDEGLLVEIQNLGLQELSKIKANDPRYGNGYCTNYELFTRSTPAIMQLERDLLFIARKSLEKEICSFKYESFLNIYNAGAGIKKHAHLSKGDHEFDLWRHKFSLVYYLDPGDQNSNNPGILKLYDPGVELLPSKGMIVIFPANRMHSSFYDGTKSRLMVGVNFYAF